MAWSRCMAAQVLIRVKALGLKAGTATQGHRFEAAGRARGHPEDADSYAEQLREEGAVIASFTERRAEIVAPAEARRPSAWAAACTRIDDDALLDEVTALVERPNVLVCQFEEEFLDVPQECLILTMKANQKYFPLLDAAGKLTNQFLIVSNISPQDPSRRDRRQRARGAPAPGRCQVLLRPGPQEDPGQSRVDGLDKVVYHNKLGTQGERVQRVRAIAQRHRHSNWATPHWRRMADQAALLAKTDLRDRHGRRVPRAAGHHGPLLRPATTAWT